MSLPSFIRKRIEEACDSAEHPKGMSVHNGMARIHASDIRRLLAVIDALLAAPAQTDAAFFAKGVEDQYADGSGFWQSCSGCLNSEDGHPVGDYPHSSIFKCLLGSGCEECGGLGAIWHRMSDDDIATILAAPAQPAAEQEPESWQSRIRVAGSWSRWSEFKPPPGIIPKVGVVNCGDSQVEYRALYTRPAATQPKEPGHG